MRTKINKFGFEIEGEFTQDFADMLVKKGYGNIVNDGSLNPCSSQRVIDKHHNSMKDLHTLEFVSKVIDYSDSGKKTMRKIFKLFSENVGNKEYHWNRSCGFHIHLSFRPKLPVEIWSVEFANFFKYKLEKEFK